MNSSSEQSSNPTPSIQAFHFPTLPSGNSEHKCQVKPGNAYSNNGDPEHSEEHFNRGVREGMQRAESLAREEIDFERQRVIDCLQGFEQERNKYFAAVEREAVKLACSIARRVLHREAQVDQQLLLRFVRSALQDVQSATRITIFVNPALAEEWSAAFLGQTQQSVQIARDENLPLNQSRIETDLGSTDIGWEVQLAEVERGLFDLMEKTPGRIQ